MIFFDESKIRTLMASTGVTKKRLLEALGEVIASNGDKGPMCSLWYDQGGIRCTFCGEGIFDGNGDHACEEVCNEDEGERVEFYGTLREELEERLPDEIDPPDLLDVKTFMENEGAVTEPGGFVDMVAENAFRSCWYRKNWNCCALCGKVYFGQDDVDEEHCLKTSKERLRETRVEVEKWLPGC